MLNNFTNKEKIKILSWLICGALSLIGLFITKDTSSFNVMWFPFLVMIFGD